MSRLGIGAAVGRALVSVSVAEGRVEELGLLANCFGF